MARFNGVGQGKSRQNETGRRRIGRSGQQQHCMGEDATR